MVGFEQQLKAEGLSLNTISFYMRNLRSIYNRAVEMQLIVSQEIPPFKYVFTGRERTVKRALTQHEINRLNNADIPDNKHLFFARQLFFFGFHAKGMSFVDMAYLKKSDCKNGTIRYRRKKTGRIIELKVTSQLRELIDYFAPMVTGSPYLLPIITDSQKSERLQYESALRTQNSRLKALARLSGLEHALTTHVSRHTWASLAKQIHTPIAVISESLGHSDEKTTQIYLASFDRKVLDRVGERVSNLIG
jgi:integrase